jgi:hypothetical protein
MHQRDIVTAYLYGTLDHAIHMEAPPELMARVLHHCQGEPSTSQRSQPVNEQFAHTNANILRSTSKNIARDIDLLQLLTLKTRPASIRPSVQVLRSIYGLKQSGRTWFQHFKHDMLARGFKNSDLTPCLFIKQDGKEFIIVAIYVDDLNLFGTDRIIQDTIRMLKKVFEMRDLGKTAFCLGLQFDYLSHGILLHQTTYTKRILKHFHMDNLKPVKSPMDLRSLDKHKDIFRKREDHEPLLGSEVPYLSATGALMFLATQTRPDIAFSVSLQLGIGMG